MKKSKLIVLSAGIAVSLSGAPLAANADSEPFQSNENSVSNNEAKPADGKCGADKKGAKKAEGKCGGGMCCAKKKGTDGKSDANKKSTDGKCGANKKGADKPMPSE